MTPQLDLEASVGMEAILGRIAKRLDDSEARLRRMEDRIPQSVDFYGSGVFPSSGNLLIVPNPAGPPAGRLWHVRFWVPGSDPATSSAPAGTVFAFVGMIPGNATQGDMSAMFRDKTATALPVPAYYSDYENTVHYPASIYFIVTGGTNNTAYTVHGLAKQELDMAAVGQEYSL